MKPKNINVVKKEEKRYKPLSVDQKEVLTHKKRIAEMEKLKYMMELNKVMFDIEHDVSKLNLEFQRENYEKSVEIEVMNIKEIDRLIEQGFEIKEQQTSDAVSDQFGAKDRLKKKGKAK